MITDRSGASIDIGALAEKAASTQTRQVPVELTPRARASPSSAGRTTGSTRCDAVTGRKKFAMDLDVPDAKPTMVCRPPTINGKVGSVANLAEVARDAGGHRRRR